MMSLHWLMRTSKFRQIFNDADSTNAKWESAELDGNTVL
jgi:hypothetical protein